MHLTLALATSLLSALTFAEVVQPPKGHALICNKPYDEGINRCRRDGAICNPMRIAAHGCTNIPGTRCMEFNAYDWTNLTVCTGKGCGGTCSPVNNHGNYRYRYGDEGPDIFIFDVPGTASIVNSG